MIDVTLGLSSDETDTVKKQRSRIDYLLVNPITPRFSKLKYFLSGISRLEKLAILKAVMRHGYLISGIYSRWINVVD